VIKALGAPLGLGGVIRAELERAESMLERKEDGDDEVFLYGDSEGSPKKEDQLPSVGGAEFGVRSWRSILPPPIGPLRASLVRILDKLL
jgi:hypothetical protein